MSDTDEPVVMTICQGPPRCMLEKDDAVRAIKDGCVWCDRCYINSDGSETWARVSDDTRKS